MERFEYLIIGGGMAAHAAATAIRELDPDRSMAIVSAERDAPYARPPLSKKLWVEGDEAALRLPPVPGLELRLGRRAIGLDPAAHLVTADDGASYAYRKLLIATGGAPRRLPWADERIVYYRTLEDFRRVRDRLAAGGRRVLVVGGGFIGSEMAAALRQRGAEVTMAFPGPRLCARVLPAELGDHVTAAYRERGVEVWAGEALAGLAGRGDALVVRTRSGREREVDLVVAGLGVAPAVELARAAGLAVSDGIDVDAELRTSAPDVWAAGDVARFPSPALGRRVRVEHEDAALTTGRAAGRAMAGAAAPYLHLPFFYSDLFDMGYEAVGEVDARLAVVADWKAPLREGVLRYVAGGRVRGVLLWNTFGQVDAARALILRDARGAGAEAAGAGAA